MLNLVEMSEPAFLKPQKSDPFHFQYLSNAFKSSEVFGLFRKQNYDEGYCECKVGLYKAWQNIRTQQKRHWLDI